MVVSRESLRVVEVASVSLLVVEVTPASCPDARARERERPWSCWCHVLVVEVALASRLRRILIVEVVSSSSLHEVASSHRTRSLLLREVAPLGMREGMRERTSAGQGRGPAVVIG